MARRISAGVGGVAVIAAPALDFAARLDQLGAEHDLPDVEGPWRAAPSAPWVLMPGRWLLEDVTALLAWAAHLDAGWQALAVVVPGGGIPPQALPEGAQPPGRPAPRRSVDAIRVRIAGRLLGESVELVGYTSLEIPGVGGWGMGYVDPSVLREVAAAEWEITGGRMRRPRRAPRIPDVPPVDEQLPILDATTAEAFGGVEPAPAGGPGPESLDLPAVPAAADGRARRGPGRRAGR